MEFSTSSVDHWIQECLVLVGLFSRNSANRNTKKEHDSDFVKNSKNELLISKLNFMGLKDCGKRESIFMVIKCQMGLWVYNDFVIGFHQSKVHSAG